MRPYSIKVFLTNTKNRYKNAFDGCVKAGIANTITRFINENTEIKDTLIHQNRQEFNTQQTCLFLDASHGGYYSWHRGIKALP